MTENRWHSNHNREAMFVRHAAAVFVFSFGLTGISACQPNTNLTTLPIEAGDLVMVAVNPFAQPTSPKSPDVSMYLMSEDNPPQWEFIESRTPEPERMSWVSNTSGGLVVTTSSRAEALLIWRIALSDLKGLSPQTDGLIFRLRGDPAPVVDGFRYRCIMSATTCEPIMPSTQNRALYGPASGGSCTLDKFGEAYYYERVQDEWTLQELPGEPSKLRDFALESYDQSPMENCSQTPWEF